MRTRHRWILAGVAVVGFLVTLGVLLWPKTGSVATVGTPETTDVTNCHGTHYLRWSTTFELPDPAPAQVLPRVRFQLQDLTGSDDGTFELVLDLLVNGEPVARRIAASEYRVGTTGSMQGAVAEERGQLTTFAHRAGVNEVRLATAATCKMESGQALSFRLTLGPLDVVTYA